MDTAAAAHVPADAHQEPAQTVPGPTPGILWAATGTRRCGLPCDAPTPLTIPDPLLYDRLIRRFQTAAEREAEGRRKGYSGVLEADLYRSEAKLAALRNPDAHLFTYRRGPDGEILAEEKDVVPRDKEEGFRRWRWEMEMRFIRGGDDDFDYAAVDESEEYDDRGLEEREAQEVYFDQEEPRFVVGEEGVVKKASRELEGETGVQDF